MKFTTTILALFVAFAAANPVPAPDAAVSAGEAVEDAKIVARQSCGKCYSGTKTCCGMGGCIMVKC
jgi:hypothetical protein